jgi:hypothetical protein
MLARILYDLRPADGGKSSVQEKAIELAQQALTGGTWIIHSDGTVWPVSPKNGKDFKLEEMQKIVGGIIQIVHAQDGRIIVLHEEGKLIGLPPNVIATHLFGNPNDIIVGDVLVCLSKEVK